MEHDKLKMPQGYLLITSALLVVIMALVATLTAGMFAGSAKSVSNMASSRNALYLATSALEIAKRDIVTNKNTTTCFDINDSPLYTNASIDNVPGTYTVSSCYNKAYGFLKNDITSSDSTVPLAYNGSSSASTTLSSAINQTTTSIPLTNSQAFRRSGAVVIDDEYISYSNISRANDTLLNASRGVLGTKAISHAAGNTVNQGFFTPFNQIRGTILVENEYMSYGQANVNVANNTITLQNVIRGIGGSTAALHLANNKARQYQCILHATAALPSLDNIEGRRMVTESLIANDGDVFNFSGFEASFVSVGNVILDNKTLIQNLFVSNTSYNFAGSTVVTGSTVEFRSLGRTAYIGGGSDKQVINPDVQQNIAAINSATLFSNIFTTNFTNIRNLATLNVSPANFATTAMGDSDIVLVNGDLTLSNADITSPKAPLVLIIDGNFVLDQSTNVTIGSNTNPTIFIVNGNFSSTTNSASDFKANGLVYVMPSTADSLSLLGVPEFYTVNGFLAVNGQTTINPKTGATNAIILTEEQSLIGLVKDSRLLSTSFNNRPVEIAEVFN